MEIAVNIILLLSGFVGAIAAIGGDTWHNGSEPVLKRITNRGWLSIVALTLTLTLGVAKEFRAAEKAKEAEVAQVELKKQLSVATGSLETANQKLERAQRSLAAIEPEILEGMFQLTERIPREQDFAFANVSGGPQVIPKSSETGEQLVLYGGDVFEWHHFCNNARNRPDSIEVFGKRIRIGDRDSIFMLDTGYRRYEIGNKEGEIRISGPIGVPMKATILNLMGFESCGFKIVVRSTDRTRTRSQFEPLLRKIREAKAVLQ